MNKNFFGGYDLRRVYTPVSIDPPPRVRLDGLDPNEKRADVGVQVDGLADGREP